MTAVVPKLERALVWDEAGHLAETAVTALADGEITLLPADAVQHAEACPACADRIGQAVMFALEVGDAIALEAEALAPSLAAPIRGEMPQALATFSRVSSSSPPAPLPVPALVSALLVALVASGPWLYTLETRSLAQAVGKVVQLLASVYAVTRAPGVVELAWLAAAVLALAGVAVARLAARTRGTAMVEGLR